MALDPIVDADTLPEGYAKINAHGAEVDAALAGKAATSHAHAASDITSGTVATARLGSGTADGTTVLFGDQTWGTPAGGGDVTLTGTQTLTNKTLTAPTITDGTFTGEQTFTEATVTTVTADTLAFNRTLGTDHTFHGTTLTGINAGATIAQFEAVYYDFTAGEWLLADANGTNTYPADGIALAASTDGAALTVLTQGFVRDDTWNWSAGPIYLSGTAGALTQTAPSTSGDKVQIVGKAISADVALFKFDPTFVQVA